MDLLSENHNHPAAGEGFRFFPRDPRVGVVAYLLIIIAAFALRQFWGVFCLLLYVLVLYLLCGFTLAAVWRRTKKIVLFALLAVLLNAVLVKGEALISIGDVSILSREGLWRGAYYFVQIHVLFLSTGLFVSLTSPEQFAKAIASIVSPIAPAFAKRLALYAFLSLGFLPFFVDEFHRITTLQKFRGGGLTGGLARKLKGVRLLLVPLLLSAVRRSEQLAMVIELRDLKNKVGGLVALGRPRLQDYGFVLLTLVVIAAAYLSCL
jgi:energy-coupling factor transport system permease protein